ncbi:DNA-protecting protein DprA [Corynebacterium yudongzhengii]|uniref:DNA-protecting protein DprA n=1 Tax=Corynebacterium yudongzhengii TaxID=2080740 RepID=A0A2U1T692_9CORY|nr:DNA-processing protein DprA [Corynebacterium yudongzhengii]AWB81685.1 DNA-protecting protein DprA [Corynebacterium yudongzhengii]PWC01512.1 DNA-protecting protein DprA [Corynebacterium yudongzhengii]
MSEKKSWAYLNRVIEGPSRELWALLNAGYDADAIARGVRTRASWIGELARVTEARYQVDSAQRDLEEAQRRHARLITPDDEEWPTTELDYAFGCADTGLSEHLHTYQSDAVSPHALWVRGANLRMLTGSAVGMVGTRTATRYGIAATEQLVSDLAGHHWTIVSGGAKGIDTAAHQAALAANAPTVVISACGIDRVYPSDNRALFEAIPTAQRPGAIVTEYPPGTPPQRHRFLTRNRLVAALTQGTVIVEAAWRSGALNTLSWAEGLGRVSMAVPGPITSTTSLGCHQRIRHNRAQLVTSGADIRGLLEALSACDTEQQYELAFAPDEIQALSRNELRIFDALPRREARETDAIAREAGMTVPLTVTLLVELSRRGLVVREDTCWRRTADQN